MWWHTLTHVLFLKQPLKVCSVCLFYSLFSNPQSDIKHIFLFNLCMKCSYLQGYASLVAFCCTPLCVEETLSKWKHIIIVMHHAQIPFQTSCMHAFSRTYLWMWTLLYFQTHPCCKWQCFCSLFSSMRVTRVKLSKQWVLEKQGLVEEELGVLMIVCWWWVSWYSMAPGLTEELCTPCQH